MKMRAVILAAALMLIPVASWGYIPDGNDLLNPTFPI